METEYIIAIFAPMMPLIVAILKRIYPEENPRVIAVGITVVIASVAGVGKLYFGDELVDVLAKVGVIASFVFGVGTALYKLQK